MLNEQVRREAISSSNYLAISSWCERNGYIHSARFFEQQSDEERVHMKKIFNYISSVGGTAIVPEITNIVQEFDSFRSVFEIALEQEIAITHSINNIVDKCYKLKDYTTASFLGWFIDEQVEEEATARRCLEIFELVGEEGVGKILIDREIGKVRGQMGE